MSGASSKAEGPGVEILDPAISEMLAGAAPGREPPIAGDDEGDP